eukprot:132954_1
MNNPNTKLSFECFGAGCKQLGTFDVPTFGENIDINIHACSNGRSCLSKHDCIRDFMMDCNDDNVSSTFEYGPLFCSEDRNLSANNTNDSCGCYMSTAINFEDTCPNSNDIFNENSTGFFGENVVNLGHIMNDNKYIIIGVVSVIALLLLAMNIYIYLKTLKSNESERRGTEIQLEHMRSGSTSYDNALSEPGASPNKQPQVSFEMNINTTPDTAHTCFRRLLFMDNFIWFFMTCLTIYDLYTDFILSISWFTFENELSCIPGCTTLTQSIRGDLGVSVTELGVILFIASLIGFVVTVTTKIIEFILLTKIFHLRKYIDW